MTQPPYRREDFRLPHPDAREITSDQPIAHICRCVPVYRGPLSYQILEEAYQDACYGRREPAYLRGGRETLERVRDYLRQSCSQTPVDFWNGPLEAITFNLAVLTVTDRLPASLVIFDGSLYPSLVWLEAGD